MLSLRRENAASRMRRSIAGAAAADAEYVLKKTENRILLSVSVLGPSTNGKDLEKRKYGILENSDEHLKNTDGKKKKHKSNDATED